MSTPPVSIKPNDVISDEDNHVVINNMNLRKGTVAAFLRNIELFEDASLNTPQKQEVIETLKELAPAIVAVGLSKHMTFKNPAIQILVNEAESTMAESNHS